MYIRYQERKLSADRIAHLIEEEVGYISID
ncbi:MAG: hypothetical protein ACI9HK_005457 [Pirellulaceae bacterium]|jgi:hypothetical protein